MMKYKRIEYTIVCKWNGMQFQDFLTFLFQYTTLN